MTVEKELEIRGINRSEIIKYLEELNGEYQPETDMAYDTYRHGKWTCQVSPERSFRFMHSDVPVVKVLFISETDETLAEVLKSFRLKTFRAGG